MLSEVCFLIWKLYIFPCKLHCSLRMKVHLNYSVHHSSNVGAGPTHTSTNYNRLRNACARCRGRPDVQIPRESRRTRWAAHSTQMSNAHDNMCSKCVLCMYEMTCMSWGAYDQPWLCGGSRCPDWGPSVETGSPWGTGGKKGANVHSSMSRPFVSSQKK